MIKKLPPKEFLESFQLVPRIAVNLLIKRNSEILLSKRFTPPLKGFWHIPGSFLLKGEKLLECLKRVGTEELNLNIKSENAKLIGVFEDLDKDPRGHVVDIVYGYSIKISPKETKNLRFFIKLPEKIGFGHEKILFYVNKSN